jgi:hypothetical protein
LEKFGSTAGGILTPRRGRVRQRESNLLFVQAPTGLWDSDWIPAIDLPVANAMMKTVPG